MADLLGVNVAKIRPYCTLPGADAHFGAVPGRKGPEYPESASAKFREAMMMGPRNFADYLANVASGAVVPHGGSDLSPALDPNAERAIQVLTQRLSESVSESLSHSLSQIAREYAPVPADELLTREEVKTILRGSIPKTLPPVAKDPMRWSRRQVHRHIESLVRGAG